MDESYGHTIIGGISSMTTKIKVYYTSSRRHCSNS
jgi:hypothetical protein